ncbi:MAG: septum formation initiator family protein [Clostridia bacterium]|nr:septum formation initiator family protein [Clostridia bacterium]
MKKRKKIYIKILIILIGIYVVITLINQQKTLNEYKRTSKNLEYQIAEQEKKQKELNDKKEKVGSLEFIEDTAREKLDMYLPNERVYLDKGN